MMFTRVMVVISMVYL